MPKRHEMKLLGLALWLTPMLGCNAPAAPSPPAAPATPAAPVETATSSTPASSVVAPTQDAAGAPKSEPHAGAPDGPAPAPSPFHVLGEHEAPVALFGLDAVGFVYVDGRLLELRGNRVGHTRTPNRGLPSGAAYEDLRVSGLWPGTAFVTTTRTDRNRRRSELFFWNGSRWKSKLQTRKSTVIRALAPWNLRRVLALLQRVDDGAPSFQVVAGFPLSPVPQPSPSSEKGCRTEVRIEKCAILPSGHVFGAGPRCASKLTAVEHWAPGKKHGQVDTLPESMGLVLSDVVAIDASSVTVAGRSPQPDHAAYLATFDGTAWKRQPAPMRSGVSHLVAGADGVLWAVTSRGAVWKRSPANAWIQVPMPPKPNGEGRIEAVSLWPKAPGDVWIVGRYEPRGGESQAVLLHTHPLEGTPPFASSKSRP